MKDLPAALFDKFSITRSTIYFKVPHSFATVPVTESFLGFRLFLS
jgi:hypothetical protein